MAEADPEAKQEFLGKEGGETADDSTYKPTQERPEGTGVPEGTELEPEDEEVV